jgi:beta-lactamase regulating signal transducer with metallopeptidase domain
VAWPRTVAIKTEQSEVATVSVPVFELEDEIVSEKNDATELPPTIAAVEVTPAVDRAIAWDIRQTGVLVWSVTSAFALALFVFQLLAVSRWLGRGRAASSELRQLVTKLSRRLGLRSSPRVVIVPNRVSPCVLGAPGRPVLMLPDGWLDDLDRLQRAAVLVHELAHLRRGDHWVRWLEVVATVPFWWHPAVWLARRELRESEELCCDGWVIATLPAARRAYADALVETVDFLANAHPALPPLASGLGDVRELRRRIHMILRTSPAFRPGKAGAAIALGLGMFLLPLGMARSDDGDDPFAGSSA